MSTQTWADLTARISTYEVLNDDEDWEIRMQGLNKRSKVHTIMFSNLEESSEFTEQFRQEGKKRPAGEQVFQSTCLSSAAELSSSSSSENNHSSFSHVLEPGMRESRTSRYSAP